MAGTVLLICKTKRKWWKIVLNEQKILKGIDGTVVNNLLVGNLLYHQKGLTVRGNLGK